MDTTSFFAHTAQSHSAAWLDVLRARLTALLRRRPVPQRQALTPEQTMARDAAAVRALAHGYRRSDPGFASDLYAAAYRAELDFEAARLAAARMN